MKNIAEVMIKIKPDLLSKGLGIFLLIFLILPLSYAQSTPPSEPTGLTVTPISTNEIDLVWEPSTGNSGVTGYYIYRSGLLVQATSATSFSDTGLTAATSYNYTVSAFDTAGNVSTPSSAASAMTLSNATPAVVKNIISDFGAACNGTADDGPAFASFNTWALQWQQTNTGLIELDIPSGSTCTFITAEWWAKGIKQLLVMGYGATIADHNGSGGFELGGAGFLSNPHSARLATAPAGATSVTLLDPSQIALFTVGNYALMTGIDLMGYGYPPNPAFHQYVKIIGVNTATGVVSFDHPLINTYRQTWPFYWNGGKGGTDLGGPATLYALDPSWDTQVEYRGLAISQNGQIYAQGRSITYTDDTFPNGCAIPTTDGTWTVNNSTMTCFIEADKDVDTVTFNNSTVGSIAFQSSSINLAQFNNTTVQRFINGSPQNIVITNSNIASLMMGTYAYGASMQAVCQNSTINAFRWSSVGQTLTSNTITNISMNNGVIAIPNSNGPPTWAVPGTNAFWGGQYANEGFPFVITDLTQDANNTYVHTSLSGGFPPAPRYSDGSLGVHDHPSALVNFNNCTGDPEVVDLSQAPGAAAFSYTKRSYSGTIGATTQPQATLWGNVVSIKINVTKPDTGPHAALMLEALSEFGIPVINPDGSLQGHWDPQVNLMQAGERVITPTAITGVQSGDQLGSAPGNVWITSGIAPSLSTNISADLPSTYPAFTIEATTDQGVVVSVSSPPVSDTTAPSTPTNLSAAAVSPSQINLTWAASTANAGIASYLIIRNGALVGTSATNSYSDTGLITSTNYVYTVKALDTIGNISAVSNIASATTQAVPGASLPINVGMILHYTFDTADMTWTNPTAGTIADAAGYQNNGTLVGMNESTTPTTGIIGQALNFNNGSYVDAANSPSLGITNSLTLSAWINTNASSNQTIMGRWGNSNSYMLVLSANSSCSPSGLHAIVYLSLPTWGTLCSSSIISTGQWHMVTATYDGSTEKLYVDGVLDNSQAASGPINNGGQDLQVGPAFNGIIDDVRIYDLALSAPVVQQLYQAPNATVMPGDANGDGTVNIADAEQTAQAVVGLVTLTPAQQQAAMVSSKTETQPSIYDAFLIAEYAVGLITQFPVQA